MRESGQGLVGFIGAVTALSLGLVAWTGVLVTLRYQPDGGGLEDLLPSSAKWSRQLVDLHGLSLSIAVGSLLIWCVVAVASRGWRDGRSAVVLVSTIGAIAVLALSVAAWRRVRFDQLALWAVTTGSDAQGLWGAAFSNQVRFVFVDGSGELPQSRVAPWVVTYLVAPFAALALFGIGWLTTRPPREERRSVVNVDG